MEPKDSNKQTITLNLSRAPLGELAAAELVEAVAAGDDRLEHHYIEIKSDIDPKSRVGHAKIAKYILGSANRLPEVASRAFEGYGVMVLGVAPGRVLGIPPLEPLEISKGVRPYLGAAGPHWDVLRVPVKDSDNEVLVIVVDPPADGQGPFLCRANGEGVLDGHIYVRADGETRDAKADEIDRLLERGGRSSRTEVEFEVEVLGRAFPVEIDEQQTLDEHCANIVGSLIDALPRTEPEPEPEQPTDHEPSSELSHSDTSISEKYRAALGVSASSALTDAMKSSTALSAALSEALKPQTSAMSKMLEQARAFQSSSNFGILSDPETRTEEEYREAVNRWEKQLRRVWPESIDTLIGHLLEPVSVRVKNKAKTFFHDLELKIHLEGEVDGLEWRDGGDGLRLGDLGLPTPPRRWGPIERSMFGRDLMSPMPYLPIPDTLSRYHSPLDWKNGGSVDLTLKVGDLRPLGEYLFDEDELVLVLPLVRDTHVKGTWEITASGHDEIYAGEVRVEVGPPIDLTPLVRRLLKLDASD